MTVEPVQMVGHANSGWPDFNPLQPGMHIQLFGKPGALRQFHRHCEPVTGHK